MSFENFENKCYGCWKDSHPANACRILNAICHSCNKVSCHCQCCSSIFEQRWNRGKMQLRWWRDSRSNFTKLNSVRDNNKNDKYKITWSRKKYITVELDTGASISSLSSKLFSNMSPDKTFFHTSVTWKLFHVGLV